MDVSPQVTKAARQKNHNEFRSYLMLNRPSLGNPLEQVQLSYVGIPLWRAQILHPKSWFLVSKIGNALRPIFEIGSTNL